MNRIIISEDDKKGKNDGLVCYDELAMVLLSE